MSLSFKEPKKKISEGKNVNVVDFALVLRLLRLRSFRSSVTCICGFVLRFRVGSEKALSTNYWRISDKLRCQRGSNAAEYALLIGFIAIAIVVGVGFVGVNLNAFYERIADGLALALG